MSRKLEEIINEALELSLEERAQLAGALLVSLDEPSEFEVERHWLREAERRLQDFREGKVKGIPAEEVFNRAVNEETALLSEPALAKDWNRPEEDVAWSHLHREP